MPAAPAPASTLIETDIPARLDRLPWSRFHWLVVFALGITWVLDGLEVTIAGLVAGALRESPTLRFSAGDVGFANSAYLLGAVAGALLFGWLTDRLGRKKLFSVTLGVYLVATAATAFARDLPSFVLFRFLTGMGIGGEYSAINSAIQELIPARHRGWTDLSINGSYWVGTAMASLASLLLLDPALVGPDMGWRLAFFLGAAIGLVILLLRRWIPESPRWLIIHGRAAQAEATVARIEAEVAAEGHKLLPAEGRARIASRTHTPLSEVAQAVFGTYRARAAYGLVLMVAQAFFYNAIFFTYALLLTDFYDVPSRDVGWYILPFAAGNVAGPLVLGRYFDSWGRRPMIVLTYGLSAAILTVSGLLFREGLLDATTQTLLWSVTFFFASAAASSAYLTVAESFPLEVRALAIAIFYAAGTGIGGVAAPWLFGTLIETGSRDAVLGGYLLGAGLMAAAALVAWRWGVEHARQPLEAVAPPLSYRD